ncbi:hypothetical protein [Phaeovulum sp.]|uniref:hypothetical protein n=1 Tax=Phaeovulum sp. TaxID=2934796 RepID=UPI0039E5471E
MRMPAILTIFMAIVAGTAQAQDTTASETLNIPPIAEATNFVPFLLPAVLAGAAVTAAAAGSSSSATATAD